MPVTNSSLPKRKSCFCHGNHSPCRSSSYQKVASAPTSRAEAVHIRTSPGFLKTEAVVRNAVSMDCMVQEHLKLHWDGKSRVEVYHLAQLLVMTLSSRFFTGLQDKQERSAKLTRLTNVITSGPHTTPLNVAGTAFYRAMKAANAMRKEVMLLIKEKKTAMSSGANEIKINDIMSHLLFNPDPTGGFMPENEVTDKLWA
ncbi:cytochrome P450, family 716, subfamily A, polypeptide 1 [Prunus dulcis]|uniref:Cytochrome P450, family 716, subfamily A, polypeptide 1 n=1 Tax=Prunus dulcis TaxID=3755 RepID=A0A4Y1QRM3_PRUDU|nr:cytochrome P450, family 716, subfamily A, polypeptide 1 [Prunus dulcis]